MIRAVSRLKYTCDMKGNSKVKPKLGNRESIARPVRAFSARSIDREDDDVFGRKQSGGNSQELDSTLNRRNDSPSETRPAKEGSMHPSIPLTLGLLLVAVMFTEPAQEALVHVWAQYCARLVEFPLATKVCTGVVGAFVSDIIAQSIAYRMSMGGKDGPETDTPFSFDFPRAGRLMLYAAVIGTPAVHYWYGFLDQAILPSAPTSKAAVVCKMLADQALAAPIMTTLFFSALKTMEGAPHLILPTLSDKLGTTLKANYCLWPLAHLINFTFIPPAQRVLYVTVIGIFWGAFINFMLGSASKPEKLDIDKLEATESPK